MVSNQPTQNPWEELSGGQTPYIMSNPLQREIDAIMRASGLDINQAKTAVYYAVATHMMEKLEEMPLLVLQGPAGTGKSSGMKQIEKLVHNPERITGRISEPALRDKMKRNGGYKTIFIEEADSVSEALISDRYSKKSAQRTVNRASSANTWAMDSVDIFGATVLHKRIPFSDNATKSRAIIIRTTHKPGQYAITGMSSEAIKTIADKIKSNLPPLESVGRIEDTWQPLLAVAHDVSDEEWLKYAEHQIELANSEHRAGHGYEHDEAVIYALQSVFADVNLIQQSAKISTVKDRLRDEFGIRMKNYQVEQMCIELGFKVTRPKGYPTVQLDKELLDKLLDGLHTAE